MDALTGQHVDNVIECIGLPASDASIAGRRVLTWSTAQNVTVPQYNTATTTGTVGTTPVTGTTGYTTYNTYNYKCTLRVTADERMIVTYWEVEGNEGGCGVYSSRLKSAIPKDG